MFGFGPRKGKRRSPRQVAINAALERLRPALRFGLRWGSGIGLVAGVIFALLAAETQAYRRMPFSSPVRFQLENVPEALRRIVRDDLADLREHAWSDPQLCHRVALRLQQNPWVRGVRLLTKSRPGVISVDCEYRVAAAQVQNGEYFYLVDEYGIRLPGQYRYQPDLVLLQGLTAAPPPAGQPWTGADLDAGLRLVNLLGRQPFGGQVTAVLLHNYAGRRDPYRCHLELVTADPAGRILWGSAPGEELEENTVAQKLFILSENYRQHGRIDGGHPIIDISVFPDRFLIPS